MKSLFDIIYGDNLVVGIVYYPKPETGWGPQKIELIEPDEYGRDDKDLIHTNDTVFYRDTFKDVFYT